MKKIILISVGVAALFLACTSKSTEAVKGKVTGTVQVDPKLKDTLKPTDVLYIIARNQQMGPPTAVKRIAHPEFPLKFTIGPEDAMIPGTPGFEEGANLTFAARISRLGDAKPGVGDLEGVFPSNPVHPGQAGVDIVIQQVRE